MHKLFVNVEVTRLETVKDGIIEVDFSATQQDELPPNARIPLVYGYRCLTLQIRDGESPFLLRGRFQVSIAPAEIAMTSTPPA